MTLKFVFVLHNETTWDEISCVGPLRTEPFSTGPLSTGLLSTGPLGTGPLGI
jgi:hypothetical protein